MINFRRKLNGSKKKAIVIWKGIAETSNTLYLAYDKSKMSAQKIKEMNTLFVSL